MGDISDRREPSSDRRNSHAWWVIMLGMLSSRIGGFSTGGAAGLAVLAACAIAVPARAAGPVSGPVGVAVTPITVTIDPSTPGSPVPSDFLGLSFEVKSLRTIASLGDTGNLTTLLRTLGRGIIRYGGVTADTQVAWSADGRSKPPWATTTISSDDLTGIARLARATHWRVLLTLNLGHLDPAAAGDEARSAVAALGPDLAGIELGNESDSYAGKHLRDAPFLYPTFLGQVDDYRAAIEAAAPDVPLAGPNASSGERGLRWLSWFSADARPALLTAHYYPLSRCSGYTPVVEDLLSARMHAAEDGMFARVGSISDQSGLPLRVDETNNVSCGGEAGLSDTFAASLWAVDYLTRAMTAGLAGINFHGHPENPLGYAPIAAATPADLLSGTLSARPEYYGMLLARMLVGQSPLPTRLSTSDPHISAHTFAAGDGRLHLVITDEDPPGRRPLRVRLILPGRYSPGGSILRLTAPALDARSGVTLGGAAVSPAGSWSPLVPRSGLAPGSRVDLAHGSLVLSVAPDSAVVASLLPAR